MAGEQMFEVEVIYATRRKVYINAESPKEARKLALDTANWADAADPHEDMDTLRLPKHRIFEGAI